MRNQAIGFSPVKTVIFSAILMSLGGCSTLTNMFGTDGSYREDEAKLVKQLEMPPNLFNPAKPQTQMALALQKAEQNALAETDQYDYIPNFKADGVQLKHNLSERWLEVEAQNSEQVWSSLKRFFLSMGYELETERKDIGVMHTNYQARQASVPLEDIGTLTRLLNSWRPEVADGIYDKFVARIETDSNAGLVKVYLNHSEMYSPDANEARDIDRQWRLRPYQPVIEAAMLYKTMVFFGSSSEKALAQLKVTEKMVEVVEGEELEGLAFRTSRSQAWTYLQAMVYRAGWSIDNVKATNYELWLQVPNSVREEDSFLSNLAFWRDRGAKNLPARVKLQLNTNEEDAEKVILTAQGTADTAPLNESQRRYLFESLGLLEK